VHKGDVAAVLRRSGSRVSRAQPDAGGVALPPARLVVADPPRSGLAREVIEYLDTGKVLAKDAEDEDIMFAKPGPPVEYWEGEE